jgi:hypothetical protein
MLLANENGLSFRANHLLFRAGIPADRPAVLQALQTEALQPRKCPVNYGKQTHAELCGWAGVDEHDLPRRRKTLNATKKP